MKGLLVLLVVVSAVAASHHHDHDDHEGHSHEHEHEDEHAAETAPLLSSLRWGVEWLLIGVIVVLALFILRMLLFGGPSRPAKAPVKPARKPALVFLTPAELTAFDGSDKQAPVYVALRGAIFDVSSRRDMCESSLSLSFM